MAVDGVANSWANISVFALAAAVTAFLISGSMLSKGMGGTGFAAGAFTWHPALMSPAYILFMGSGIFVYKLGGPRTSMRKLHGILQLCALLFAIAGYLFMYKAHADKGISQFGLQSTFWRLVHVWGGYAVLLLTVMQASVGIIKYQRLISVNEKVYRWHGQLGRPVFVAGIVNIVIAVWFWGGWAIPLKIIMTTGCIGVVAAIYFVPQQGGESEFQENDSGAELSSGSAPSAFDAVHG